MTLTLLVCWLKHALHWGWLCGPPFYCRVFGTFTWQSIDHTFLSKLFLDRSFVVGSWPSIMCPFPLRLESYIFIYSTTFLQVKFLSYKSRISSQKNKAIPLNTNALSLLVLVHVLCLVQLCVYQDKSSCWRSLFSTPFSSHHPLSQATTQPFQW